MNSPHPESFSTTDVLTRTATGVLFRRIWIPRVVYEALPFFYLVAGLTAFFATLYVPEWYWVVPYYFLVACGLIHAAVYVWLRRARSRKTDT
ncbi:MAG: hypothetical protein AAFZ58_11070 [Pseudomonadota bacterium]